MRTKDWFEDLLEEGMIAHGMDQEVIQNEDKVHEPIEEVQRDAASHLLGWGW